MDLNKLSTIIENNTESEFLAKKDQQSQSILQRSCQKWITDDRSDQIKQGLHGDSDLKVISSFEDVIQNGNSKTNQKAQNDSNNINELEKSQFYQFNNTCSKQNNSSFFNINENEENPSNHYQKNKVEDQKQSKLNNQNELKVNEPATSRDKQNSKYDENQKQNNRRTTQIVQINNRLRDKTCSLYLNQNQFNQQKLKKTNELFKMVNVKLKVLEFIKKMKLKYINRKLEKISKFQIEIISDKCHFFESDSSQANSCIFNLFKGIKSLIKHIPILIPTNKIIILFDLLSIIYFYLFFFFFSIIAFFNQAELNSNQFAFCCLFSVSIMLLDLFESLNMAIFRRDMIILEREVIIKSYLLSFHFLTDFISLIALLTLIVSNPNQITFNPENQIWKYIQIIIVFVKIFGVKQKIKRTKNVITLSQNQKHIYKLFSQIFSVLQIAHISCIGWYSLTFIQQNERNWLQKINIQNSAYHIKYIYSFYWAIITMSTEEEINSKLLKEEEQVLSVLSLKLREEIIQEANSQILKNFNIFNNFSQLSINKLVFQMKEIIVSPGEVIFQEGDRDDSIYLITSGQIEIQQNTAHKNCPTFLLKTLSKNQIFGEIAFFSQMPRTASAKSLNLSTLFKIERKDFIEIIQQNQRDFEIFKTIQHNILLNRDCKQIQTKCYSCNSSNHLIYECPIVHQDFDYQLINLKNNYSKKQERQKFNRQHMRMFQAKNLAGINIRIQSQLKMDQEYQSFFNSEYDQSQQFISNIQVDDSKLHGCINENSQLYFNQLNEFNNTVNNCDQITFSKKQIQIDQSYMNSSKNQAQNIASKVLVDLNQKNNTINEGNQPEKEQDILAGFVQDDISYSNLNSLGDICNKNDAITSNTKISIHKRKKKSTIMKNYNYIDNVQVDKFQSCSTNQFEQESINLSANLITDSHYTQDQKYHKYLPSFATIQLYPEDKKNKNICSKVQENKILKACKEDIQSDLKSEQSQQSMMTISSNGKREKTTSLGRKSQIQKGFKTHDGDQQYVTHGNRQSILTVQRFFQYDFDQFKNYKDYFPQNNYNLVIKEYNMIQNINFKLLFSGTQTAKLQSDNDKIKLKLSPKSRYLLLKKLQKNSICYGISTKSCSKNQQVYDKNI
ncbi:hypothetical protein ABPG73_007104 [Tetrahymena malaccensis]